MLGRPWLVTRFGIFLSSISLWSNCTLYMAASPVLHNGLIWQPVFTRVADGGERTASSLKHLFPVSKACRIYNYYSWSTETSTWILTEPLVHAMVKEAGYYILARGGATQQALTRQFSAPTWSGEHSKKNSCCWLTPCDWPKEIWALESLKDNI